MVRVTLMEEDSVWPSGVYIVPGSIYWDDAPLPVFTSAGTFVVPTIGKVTDIRREGNKITGELTYHNGHDVDVNGEYSAYISPAEIQEDMRRLIGGRLRSVSVIGAKEKCD